MDNLSKKEIEKFQREILTWYEKNKRDLPWRPPSLKLRKDGTRDPYKILVSEIMSQQTQIARVVVKYNEWMEVFPTVHDVANAKTAEVLRLWSGLGYNRRALYLQKCAQAVVADFGGKFPKDSETLQQLPGIGAYTAAAVACFAYNQQIAVIDTNIRKVILTQFKHHEIEDTPKEIEKIARLLLPKGKAYIWNQALMDYAASMLKKEKITIPKQSKFKGSNRYYRGQIIKMLLQEKELSLMDLSGRFEKEGAFIEDILTGLEKDALIKREKNTIILA